MLRIFCLIHTFHALCFVFWSSLYMCGKNLFVSAARPVATVLFPFPRDTATQNYCGYLFQGPETISLAPSISEFCFLPWRQITHFLLKLFFLFYVQFPSSPEIRSVFPVWSLTTLDTLRLALSLWLRLTSFRGKKELLELLRNSGWHSCMSLRRKLLLWNYFRLTLFTRQSSSLSTRYIIIFTKIIWTHWHSLPANLACLCLLATYLCSQPAKCIIMRSCISGGWSAALHSRLHTVHIQVLWVYLHGHSLPDNCIHCKSSSQGCILG